MEDRLLDKIAEPFNLNLPEYDNMEQMIDGILPAVRRFSEPSLEDEDTSLFRVNWVRMSDTPGDTKVILYEFSNMGGIRTFTDGKVGSESFDIVGPTRIIVGESAFHGSILYNLGFIDEDFLILKRHGNEANMDRKYLFFTREAIGTRLTWDEALERLADKYRNSQFPVLGVVLFIVAVVLAMFYFLY